MALSPWQAYPWFLPPRVNSTPSSIAGPVQIAPQEIGRVALLMGPVTSNAFASVSPDPNVQTGHSLVIGGNAGPFVITQHEHGALCQYAWFSPQGANEVYTVEVILRDWPREDTWTNANLINAISALIRALQGGFGGFAQPAPAPPARPKVPGRWADGFRNPNRKP